MADTNFLINMTIALTAAFVGATVAARLGQSTILGYILGGIAIGPFTPGLVGDVVAVETLADIGIILLMFAIGVQLSLRDLMRSGRVALLGGSAQVLLTIGLGYLVGVALGWTSLQALFFGAVVSNSSSTVLSKVLGERGEAGSTHGQVALAWSTIQDLSTIVLVVACSRSASTDANARCSASCDARGPSDQLRYGSAQPRDSVTIEGPGSRWTCRPWSGGTAT